MIFRFLIIRCQLPKLCTKFPFLPSSGTSRRRWWLIFVAGDICWSDDMFHLFSITRQLRGSKSFGLRLSWRGWQLWSPKWRSVPLFRIHPELYLSKGIFTVLAPTSSGTFGSFNLWLHAFGTQQSCLENSGRTPELSDNGDNHTTLWNDDGVTQHCSNFMAKKGNVLEGKIWGKCSIWNMRNMWNI